MRKNWFVCWSQGGKNEGLIFNTKLQQSAAVLMGGGGLP